MFLSERLGDIKKQGNIILNSRFLKNLTVLERTEFLQYCHRRNYKKEEYIYYQGDPGTGMYFIEDGKVELVLEGESDQQTHHSYIISAPESFGALSIGYEIRRISNVRCLTDCTLLGFFKPDFETLKKRHPVIAVKFMETLAVVAMKQLEIVTNELKKQVGAKHALSLQFELYMNPNNNDELL
ncbi:cyclic nucleotide-binding domain-containing protein [Fodinibius sediminis]|uniref:Cyclic nucleotide-binding domain-containing protein n=1 Tax=Fodinibius sediminis TaxID=1214077 RepID=A0A521F2K0_9BACT|nr:cyclic nucleotide-binding domain-containing protein [Fodinibius sediminis]SMO90347.1 Cyclic nucleotide-binding domain-containing protein [Fodinibius sediminis]